MRSPRRFLALAFVSAFAGPSLRPARADDVPPIVRRRVLLLNVVYSAGLMSAMLVLATFAAFAGLGWGEQFSSTTFSVTLAAIVFAFGLSFLGIWEIPVPGFVGTAGGSVSGERYGGAFSKGVLGTLLATPCSGPFLGSALAWAIVQLVQEARQQTQPTNRRSGPRNFVTPIRRARDPCLRMVQIHRLRLLACWRLRQGLLCASVWHEPCKSSNR